jgi:LPXTG-site transpeptidase (sortase) family protein
MFEAKKYSSGRTGVFASVMAGLFVCTLSVADSIGFVPYYVDGTPSSREIALAELPELGEEVATLPQLPVLPPQPTPMPEPLIVKPERIIIDTISLDLPVLNPETRDIAALDEVLKKGPARYVDSAQLGQKGNVLIFAHTSHLPVVHNQMYRAFNRLSELEVGDIVTVQGGGKEYVYTVTTVRRANAEDEIISLAPSLGHILTLVTCDTLTSKSSRWIVEAELVGSY